MNEDLQKEIRKASRERLENTFLLQIKAAGLPEPVRELRFASTRRWRFDFAWPAHKIAVECEGGTYSGGRHTRGKGFEEDCWKYNQASFYGWRVFRLTASMVEDGVFIASLAYLLETAEGQITPHD